MWRGVERRVNRRFSISAPKLSVRPHIAWYLRWGMMMPVILAVALLVWWAYGSGMETAGFNRDQAQQEISRMRDQIAKLEAGNAQLVDKVAQYERDLQIEQATNQATAEQLKSQVDKNTLLQEDLVFFQNLTEASGKEGDLGIHRLTLERDKIPGEYHLQMLLVQSGQRVRNFNGSYQLIATVIENGQSTTHVFPNDDTVNAQFKLSFRYYQRVEQSIQLPPDAQLDNVQVRVFERGSEEPKARQNVRPKTTGVNDVQ